MKNYLTLLLILIITSNCTLNKVVKKHGTRNLDKKFDKLEINTSNVNDLMEILGPPSSKSKFNNDIWYYIEREISREPLIKLGKEKLITNNVLIIEINSRGLLISKNLYDLNKMTDLDFTNLKTETEISKKSFIFDFLSSMRQKINDPLGKRKKP